MAEIMQFIIPAILAYIATKSCRFWTTWSIRLIGLIAIPVLALLFWAGQDSEVWVLISSAFGVMAVGAFNGISALFESLPIITAGTATGIFIGSGLLKQRPEW